MQPTIVEGWRDSAVALAARATVFGVTFCIGADLSLVSHPKFSRKLLARALLKKAQSVLDEATRGGIYDWEGRGFRWNRVDRAWERVNGPDNVADLISR